MSVRAVFLPLLVSYLWHQSSESDAEVSSDPVRPLTRPERRVQKVHSTRILIHRTKTRPDTFLFRRRCFDFVSNAWVKRLYKCLVRVTVPERKFVAFAVFGKGTSKSMSYGSRNLSSTSVNPTISEAASRRSKFHPNRFDRIQTRPKRRIRKASPTKTQISG